MERVQPASGINQQTCKTFILQMDRRRHTQSPLHPPHPHIPIVVAKISIYFPRLGKVSDHEAIYQSPKPLFPRDGSLSHRSGPLSMASWTAGPMGLGKRRAKGIKQWPEQEQGTKRLLLN